MLDCTASGEIVKRTPSCDDAKGRGQAYGREVQSAILRARHVFLLRGPKHDNPNYPHLRAWQQVAGWKARWKCRRRAHDGCACIRVTLELVGGKEVCGPRDRDDLLSPKQFNNLMTTRTSPHPKRTRGKPDLVKAAVGLRPDGARCYPMAFATTRIRRMAIPRFVRAHRQGT